MIKNLLVTLVVVFTTSQVILAQQYKIEKSEGFEQPGIGWVKLLQFGNGNTLYFHSVKKEGIHVAVFDKARREVARKVIVSDLWDGRMLWSMKVAGVYDINNEAVLFVTHVIDHQITLLRLRVNSSTGELIKEDVLGSVSPKPSVVWSYGNNDPNNIFVEKDPNSDCYAVIFFSGFAKDASERIRVVHYNGSHNIINDAYYESPDGMFKFLRFIGAAVDRNRRVYLTTYGHNGKSDDEATRVIVSVLKAGEHSFGHRLLNFSEDFDDTRSVMLYNHNSNRIQLLTLTFVHKSRNILKGTKTDYYLSILSSIDPETLQPVSVKLLSNDKVKAYALAHIDSKESFFGLPQQMVINKDNTITILYEKIITEIMSSGIEHQYLKTIGVSELSDTGAEISGCAINKSQMTGGLDPKLYIAASKKGVNNVYPSGQFVSFEYINTGTARYVILNDAYKNYELPESENKKRSTFCGDDHFPSNPVCYKLTDKGFDKFFLFGEPKTEQAATMIHITSSDFRKDLNTYAALVVRNDDGDRDARVAWVTFE